MKKDKGAEVQEKREPLKLTNLDEEMRDFKGRVLRHMKDAEDFTLCKDCAKRFEDVLGEHMTPRSLMIEVLYAMPIGEDGKPQNISESKKARRYFLAQKIFNHKADEPLELPLDVVATLKSLIGNRYGAAVVGEAKKWIDPGQAEKMMSGVDEI